MPGLEDRVESLEEEVKSLRTYVEEMNSNIIKLFEAVILLGGRQEDNGKRIDELEKKC